MKILLFGRSGQLGSELFRSLSVLGEVVALDRKSVGLCGDLCNLSGIADTVRVLAPDIVVNAAAWTAVDEAERYPDKAMVVNALGPAAIAAAAHLAGAWFVHYSSDYVFDGSGDRPWTETDSPQPLNAYGQSKLFGDVLIAQNCPRHLIFRTSWLYAEVGENFARTILRNARQYGHVKVVNDQVGAPTGAQWLADLTVIALEMSMKNSALSGLYHATADGETSWHGYARFLITHMQKHGLLSGVCMECIEPVLSSTYRRLAIRPLNSRLDTSKLRDSFGLYPPAWQVGVEKLLEVLR